MNNGNFEIAQLLLEYGAEPQTDKYTKYDLRQFVKNINLSKELLGKLLLSAIKTNNFDIIQTLLLNAASPNYQDAKGNTVLMTAMLYYPASMRFFVDNGADVNLHNYNSPLSIAVSRHNINESEFLLSHGADPNFRVENGNTLLHYLARIASALTYPESKNESITLISLLIDSGANRYLTNEAGETPADISRSRGDNSTADFIDQYKHSVTKRALH